MKRVNKITWFCCFMITAAISVNILGHEASAAENAGNWRSTFDLVMRWLNFGILAFLLVKFTKTPLKDFFSGKKEEIAREIKKIEEKKEKAEEKIREAVEMLDESKIRFATLKERIVEDGEKKKQKIIEDARQESTILLESAKKRIENRLLEAKKAFKSELVDEAVALALERIPKEITAEDNKSMLDLYLKGIGGR